jgi:hypothetical protein
MAYVQIPNRSSTDPNASADINQLQDNIEALKGGAGGVAPTTTIEDIASLQEFTLDMTPGSWDYPASNFPEWDRDTGTNGYMFRNLFDDTTPEYLISQFKVPANIDTSGTVTFELEGYASTADGNEVQFRFEHCAKNSGESWDAAFTAEDSGDKTTSAVQDQLDFFSWTETVSNLGWAANDIVRIRLSRQAIDDGTPVSGDYGVVHFRVRIPKS